jgi:hypothetical protein
MRALLIAGGVGHILFAAFHLSFPVIFGWQEALSVLSNVNHAIVYTLHLAVVSNLLVFAYVSIFHWRELMTTGLGKVVTIAICLLWIWRTLAEVVFFRIGVDGAWWRVAVFLVGTLLYLIPFVSSFRVPIRRQI